MESIVNNILINGKGPGGWEKIPKIIKRPLRLLGIREQFTTGQFDDATLGLLLHLVLKQKKQTVKNSNDSNDDKLF